MIDGLTRRVQHLVDDMERMRQFHHEEMQELQNERDTLRAENIQHKLALGRANRKIERLLVRKSQLKSGFALMTANRDREQGQKEALQVELLETRSVRDGYLKDRVDLNKVLAVVRSMREKLLEVHRSTENSLTVDANALKRTIEGAIVVRKCNSARLIT